MNRQAASFKRTGARFKPQPRVLVICEDTKSSKTYLEDASLYFRSHAVVEFSHCGRTDPLGIIENAIKRQHDFELVYCVIDRDTHANFDAALALAQAEQKITVIASYPCFEFWLLLHYSYTRAPFARAGALSAADKVIQELMTKPGMEDYAKGKVQALFQSLLVNLNQARDHAARTLIEAEKDGSLNPSSQIHTLIDALADLASPPANQK